MNARSTDWACQIRFHATTHLYHPIKWCTVRRHADAPSAARISVENEQSFAAKQLERKKSSGFESFLPRQNSSSPGGQHNNPRRPPTTGMLFMSAQLLPATPPQRSSPPVPESARAAVASALSEPLS